MKKKKLQKVIIRLFQKNTLTARKGISTYMEMSSDGSLFYLQTIIRRYWLVLTSNFFSKRTLSITISINT